MKIGLVLDNPQRDLTGIAFLTYQLLNREHEVCVVPMYDQGYDVPLLDLDAIIVNYARTANLEFMQSYKEMGLTVFVLDTEGGLMPESGHGSPESWAKRVHGIGAYRYIDHYFFWGSRHRSAFAQYSGIPEDRLHVTGSPRYDICHEKWRALLHSDISDYILINLNFPSINPWWGHAEYSGTDQQIQFHSALKEISDASRVVNIDLNIAIPFVEECKRVLNEYIRVLREATLRNPDRQFVLRPHPFENKEIYRQVFADRKNVAINTTGEVFSVINGADFVIHLNCGTSVETRLLGKNAYSLEFLNSDTLRVNITIPSRISIPVGSVDELDSIIKHYPKMNGAQAQDGSFREIIYPWFGQCDGNASERVAEKITSVLAAVPARSDRGAYYFKSIAGCYHRPRAKHFLLGIASQLIGSRAVESLRKRAHRKRAMKYVTPELLKQRVDQIAACDGERWLCTVTHARHPLSGAGLASLGVARS